MKLKTLPLFLFFSLAITLPGKLVAKSQPLKVDIESVLSKPELYVDEYIQVKGLVKQYIQDNSQTTDKYLLVSDLGDPMIIKTPKSLPKINLNCKVTGTYYFDAKEQRYFLAESKRVSPINPIYFILGGIIIILLILILVVLLKPDKSTTKTTNKQKNEPNPIKIDEPVSPKSLTLFPGKFEILSGPESGRTIKCPAFPKENYSIITIGSSPAAPPQDVSHILLRDRAIDREHVEFRLYDNKSIKMKNLSGSDYYTSIDEEEILPNVVADIQPGVTITLGATKIKYVQ